VTARHDGFAAVLRLPGYRRLWGARTVSQVGDVMQFTTLGLVMQ